MGRGPRIEFIVLLVGLLLPVLAWAQGSSGIAGVVRDTTGAVLPGVTVEASSPALIEKVRSVVTDDQGLYKISRRGWAPPTTSLATAGPRSRSA